MSNNTTTKTRTSKERIIPIEMEDVIISSQTSEEDVSVKADSNISVSSVTNSNEDDDEVSDPFEDEEVPKRIPPVCNVQEKIIIVFDRAQDESYTNFVLNNGSTFSPFNMLKRVTEMFVRNKSALNNKHQYALVVLNQCTASWQRGFTNKAYEILQSLSQVTECETEDVFDLNLLFDAINENVKLPHLEDSSLPPPYVVHTVLLYGRSYTIPQIMETPMISNFLNSPYFTFDVLMTHEPPCATNNCTKIFDTFENFDKKMYSYFFPVSRNAFELHVSMAKLLSHPLQRPTQKQAKYTLKIIKK